MNDMNVDRELLERIASGRPDGRYRSGWFLCGFCEAEVEGEHETNCSIVQLRNLLYGE